MKIKDTILSEFSQLDTNEQNELFRLLQKAQQQSKTYKTRDGFEVHKGMVAFIKGYKSGTFTRCVVGKSLGNGHFIVHLPNGKTSKEWHYTLFKNPSSEIKSHLKMWEDEISYRQKKIEALKSVLVDLEGEDLGA